MFQKIRNYNTWLLQDETGMEFLQVAAIVALVAGAMFVMGNLFSTITDTIGDATQQAGDGFDSMLGGGTP